MNQKPTTLSQLYPDKWLKAADLNNKPVTVTIKSAIPEQFYNKQERCDEWKVVLDFGRTKRLILNKTQCEALTAITGTETFTRWTGTQITLKPSRAHNGKPTINISTTQARPEKKTANRPAAPTLPPPDKQPDANPPEIPAEQLEKAKAAIEKTPKIQGTQLAKIIAAAATNHFPTQDAIYAAMAKTITAQAQHHGKNIATRHIPADHAWRIFEETLGLWTLESGIPTSAKTQPSAD